MTYFIFGGYENEQGAFRLPQFEEDSIASARGEVPANQIRRTPSRSTRPGNVHANMSPSFNIDASLGFRHQQDPTDREHNSFLTINGSGTTSGRLPEENRGWFFIPAELFAEPAQQEANRSTGGFTGNWPRSSG